MRSSTGSPIWIWIKPKQSETLISAFNPPPLNRLLIVLAALTGILFYLSLNVVHAELAEAALSIDTDLRPEDSPEAWTEVYGGDDLTPEQTFGPEAVSYVLADIIVVLLQIAGVLAIYFIVVSGFNYVKAFGREEEIQKAKKGLTWSIVGLIVVLLSYMIVQNIIRILLTVDDTGTTTYIENTTA